MTALRLLYSSADELGEEHRYSPAATAVRQLAIGRGETMVAASASGGRWGEAALVVDGRGHCDRNRGGAEEDEFYHGTNLHL